ncbi:MAG: hypothetical protein ACREXR_00495 [Gammaproteobacteria bacterium]
MKREAQALLRRALSKPLAQRELDGWIHQPLAVATGVYWIYLTAG